MNNAGVNYRVPLLEFPEKEWDLIIATNLKGYFLMAQVVVPQMIERGYGKVINMSSILGMVGLPTQGAYASSKGGVDQLTKIMAIEWGQAGGPGQRHRPHLFRDRTGGPIAQRSSAVQLYQRTHPHGPLGLPARARGHSDLPGLPGL